MGSKNNLCEENISTLREIQFVSEQIREGTLKGEYKDEEKIIRWNADIKIKREI